MANKKVLKTEIKQLLDNGYTRSQIGRLYGVSKQTITNWLNDGQPTPTKIGQKNRSKILAAIKDNTQVVCFLTMQELAQLTDVKSKATVFGHIQKLIDEGKVEEIRSKFGDRKVGWGVISGNL